MAINVPLTNYSKEKVSRHDLLSWVNDTLAADYNKIEELCSGTAYCKLMEQLFPGSVAIKKLKINAKMDHEYIWNLKLFQSAFMKIECDKTVPINQLMKGKFQDNFEFLQWFKKFYDVNSGANGDGSNAFKLKETNNNNNLLKSSKTKSANNLTVKSSQNSSSKSSSKSTPSPRSESPKKELITSPTNFQILTMERNNLKEQLEALEKEKVFYFARLRNVEILCDENEGNPEFDKTIQTIRKLLYSTNPEKSETDETYTAENLEDIDKPNDTSTEF